MSGDLDSFPTILCSPKISNDEMEISGKFDAEKLFYDLVTVLKDKRDINKLAQCLQVSKTLRSSTDTDFNEVRNFLRDYEQKVEACEQKTEAAKSEFVADEELDRLQRELDEDVERESLLMEELRVVTNEVSDIERQMIAMQERNQSLKKQAQEEFREQRKLAMYASVTNIIPNLEDQSSVLGYIVNRDKRMVQQFDFDPTKMTASEICNSMWKMISLMIDLKSPVKCLVQ